MFIATNGGQSRIKPSVVTDEALRKPYETEERITSKTQIDFLVLKKLRQLGIEPSRICSDEVFVRRAYLDVTGTLPTIVESREFPEERSPNKRRELIENLLESEAFSNYWSLHFCDLLRVKAEYPVDLWPNATQAYERWIRTAIRANMPYDQFARQLLTSSGSNFRTPQVNFYRAIPGRNPIDIAKTVALIFMGTRAEKWPSALLQRMSTFFSQVGYKSTMEWKEEIVLRDPTKLAPRDQTCLFPDGKAITLPPEQDPRTIFADWLVSPHNPWFARAAVNRIWYWLLGRGIVNEPDDIRPDNPASNPELLSYLEREFVSSRFDLKHIFRLILQSTTYQLASIPRSIDPKAAANFASYPIRRLEAEVLLDAINDITGTNEVYVSYTPEPYTWVPTDQRTVQLADGSITSAFLEMFGRPSRDSSLSIERTNEVSTDQRLHLLNSSHINGKILYGPGLNALTPSGKKPENIITDIYLRILSRTPTEDEMKIGLEYSSPKNSDPKSAAMDIAWALINSAEFLYRH